jgi:hypothetical protein
MNGNKSQIVRIIAVFGILMAFIIFLAQKAIEDGSTVGIAIVGLLCLVFVFALRYVIKIKREASTRTISFGEALLLNEARQEQVRQVSSRGVLVTARIVAMVATIFGAGLIVAYKRGVLPNGMTGVGLNIAWLLFLASFSILIAVLRSKSGNKK